MSEWKYVWHKQTFVRHISVGTLRYQQPHAFLPLDFSFALRTKPKDGETDDTQAILISGSQIYESLRMRVREEERKEAQIGEETCTGETVCDELLLLHGRETRLG